MNRAHRALQSEMLGHDLMREGQISKTIVSRDPAWEELAKRCD